MDIFYQDIVKIDGFLYENLDTALEVARTDYYSWCMVDRIYTELLAVFRDEETGEIVIQYKWDEEDAEVREDRFEVEWTKMAASLK
jgi:hypothetical protein